MEFFAGANTSSGFLSLFDEIFKDIERIFILKGSSGCGKSTFMKRIATEAEVRGLDFHLIRCSADVNSLDGVIIPRLNFAVADGTAPHIMDVKYPCVRENIINLGQFWEENKLLPHRAEIISLTDLKGCHYKNAYRAINAAGTVENLSEDLLKGCIDIKKLDAFAFKFSEKLFRRKGEQKKVFIKSFTANGETILSAFDNVKMLFCIKGKGAKEFMRALNQIITEKGAEAIVGCNWLNPKYTDAIFIPESEILISCIEDFPCRFYEKHKNIPTAKFLNKGKLSGIKNRLKGLSSLKERLFEEAQAELASARETHNQLEKIYIPAMDFEKVNEFTDTFIKKLFGA